MESAGRFGVFRVRFLERHSGTYRCHWIFPAPAALNAVFGSCLVCDRVRDRPFVPQHPLNSRVGRIFDGRILGLGRFYQKGTDILGVLLLRSAHRSVGLAASDSMYSLCAWNVLREMEPGT